MQGGLQFGFFPGGKRRERHAKFARVAAEHLHGSLDGRLGLVARPSISRQRGNSLCDASGLASASIAPLEGRLNHGDYVLGDNIANATETTPRPPIDKSGSVRLSSPLRIVRSVLFKNVRCLIHRTGSFLDHRDIGKFRQTE